MTIKKRRKKYVFSNWSSSAVTFTLKNDSISAGTDVYFTITNIEVEAWTYTLDGEAAELRQYTTDWDIRKPDTRYTPYNNTIYVRGRTYNSAGSYNITLYFK